MGKRESFWKRLNPKGPGRKQFPCVADLYSKPLNIYIREDRCEKKAGGRKMMWEILRINFA